MKSSSDFWENKYENDSNYRNLFPYDHVVSTVYTIASKLKRPLKVLELGSGCGNNLLSIPSSIISYGVGLDVSKVACDFASSKDIANRFYFIPHNLLSFPYPLADKKFDLVLDRSCLSLLDKSRFKTVFEHLKGVLDPPFYFYSNPYSDLHSSRPCEGLPISKGSNPGVINAAEAFYYSRNDILDLFSNTIVDLRLCSIDNFTHAQRLLESEWRVLAYVK